MGDDDLEISPAWRESCAQALQLVAGQPCGRTPLNRRAKSYVPISELQDARCPSVSSQTWNRPCKPVLDAAGPYSLPSSTNANGCRLSISCVPPVLLAIENSPADALCCRSDSCRSDTTGRSDVLDSQLQLPALEALPHCQQTSGVSDCSTNSPSRPRSSEQEHTSSSGDILPAEAIAALWSRRRQEHTSSSGDILPAEFVAAKRSSKGKKNQESRSDSNSW